MSVAAYMTRVDAVVLLMRLVCFGFYFTSRDSYDFYMVRSERVLQQGNGNIGLHHVATGVNVNGGKITLWPSVYAEMRLSN